MRPALPALLSLGLPGLAAAQAPSPKPAPDRALASFKPFADSAVPEE